MLHHQSAVISFEAQLGRTYVLWRADDVTSDEWIKVQQFSPQPEKRTISYEIPAEHRPVSKGYYRLTIPAKND